MVVKQFVRVIFLGLIFPNSQISVVSCVGVEFSWVDSPLVDDSDNLLKVGKVILLVLYPDMMVVVWSRLAEQRVSTMLGLNQGQQSNQG